LNSINSYGPKQSTIASKVNLVKKTKPWILNRLKDGAKEPQSITIWSGWRMPNRSPVAHSSPVNSENWILFYNSLLSFFCELFFNYCWHSPCVPTMQEAANPSTMQPLASPWSSSFYAKVMLLQQLIMPLPGHIKFCHQVPMYFLVSDQSFHGIVKIQQIQTISILEDAFNQASVYNIPMSDVGRVKFAADPNSKFWSDIQQWLQQDTASTALNGWCTDPTTPSTLRHSWYPSKHSMKLLGSSSSWWKQVCTCCCLNGSSAHPVHKQGQSLTVSHLRPCKQSPAHCSHSRWRST